MSKLAFGLAALTLSVCGAMSSASAGTLDHVRQNGILTCGTNQATPGFSIPDSTGKWTGFVVDYCRAIAAATLGDASKVKYIPLSAKDRFTALQSGEIDVLAFNATWTYSRDTSLGIKFSGIYFYDGQSFLVKKSLGAKTVKDLDGASICLSQGTTTELNVADYFHSHGMKFDSVGFADDAAVLAAFQSGRCDAFSADSSSLNAARLQLPSPSDYEVLPDLISKEPLGPAVRQDDPNWFDISRWTLDAMITAEELGVTSANVDEMKKNSNPDIRRLLGVEGGLGHMMGVDDQWAYKIIKQVGNFGEVFERNIGADSPLKIKRGANALWNKGGLLYSPPMR